MQKLLLVLIPELSLCDIRDFQEIADNMRQQAPDIEVRIIKRRQLWWRQLAYLFRPSLYVAFYEAKQFKPLRGLCLHGKWLTKAEQYTRMQNAGIDVIPWQKISPGKEYSASEWGQLVIIKPDEGREGRGVYLSRPEQIVFENVCADGETHLIQKFINTGDCPNYYRCLTLFGETLYLRKTTNDASLLTADVTGELPDPVANAAHGNAELVNDPEVIEFARKIATTSFPQIPLLGQDIVRERISGRLYCLEVNSYGSTWHFSTPVGRKLQLGENIDYKKQFDAFKVAADVLITKTRLLAR